MAQTKSIMPSPKTSSSVRVFEVEFVMMTVSNYEETSGSLISLSQSNVTLNVDSPMVKGLIVVNQVFQVYWFLKFSPCSNTFLNP